MRSLFQISFHIVLVLCFAVSAWAQDLTSLHLDQETRARLEKAIVELAPGLIITVDSTTLKVAAFVNGSPEKLDINQFQLVDMMASSNGRPGMETPEGLFSLVSGRMNEEDWSNTYKTKLLFTLFWRNLRTKEFDGYGIHAAPQHRLNKLGIQCASHGCVNLHPQKAETLFREVKGHFSSQHNGSDVLVLSHNGVNSNLPVPSVFEQKYSAEMDYFARWNEISRKSAYRQKHIKPTSIELAPLSESLRREEILIDTRKPIAGNGDTASSLFLIQNLLSRGFEGNVDILVDDKSERIIRTLSKNLTGFDSQRIRLLRVENLEAKKYSLVIRSGQPSGRIFIENLRQMSKSDRALKNFINTTESTIFLAFTIYGNTQNRYSLQPLSLTSQGGSYFLLPATGLGAVRSAHNEVQMKDSPEALKFEEAGIFRDPFSLSIRDWTIENIENYIAKEAAAVNPDLKELLETVADLRKRQESKYSLAYGFSIPQVKGQARDYFRSLLASPEPIVVLTPSAFGTDLLQSFTPEEQTKIQLTSLREFTANGHRLSRNHLTVVQIPNVPHQIFASLMLASHRNRVVPLGAGDGFFTTALSLGVPFAPTIVEWNIRNVRALARVLQVEGFKGGLNFSHLQNLRRLYSAVASDPIQLGYSQQLLRYEELFRKAIFQIPDLTGTIDSTVDHLRTKAAAPRGLQPIEKEKRLFVGEETQIQEKKGRALKCEMVYRD